MEVILLLKRASCDFYRFVFLTDASLLQDVISHCCFDIACRIDFTKGKQFQDLSSAM
jgi:hypothetical protein